MKHEHLTHVSGIRFTIENHGAELSEADRSDIASFEDSISHNDLTCKLTMWDRQLPSGRWLENIKLSNDLHTARAYME